ncbi:MAG: hypothetical protein FWE10_03545 [Rikenellaceae bacterium]|nr:hypothetical protein [Rikenellaceae bacterium]MCL2693039.1 hypothetical protein [Rikenellaceae bacterium]
MRKILLLTAAAVFAFASCTKENKQTEDGPKTLTVKIGNAETRAVQAPGTAIPATLSSGIIFLIDPSGNVIGSSITLNVGQATTTGQVINNVSSSARVYILGNVVAGDVSAVSALTTWSAIQAYASDIAAYQTTLYTAAALGNQAGVPAGITVTSTTEANVSINLTPLHARLELFGVTSALYTDPGNSLNQTQITNFDVIGVYVDSYYPNFTYGGGGSGTLFQINQAAPSGGIGDTGTWPAVGTPPTMTTGPNPSIWGYNVAAGSLPRLVIALTTIEYEVSTDGGSTWTPGTDITSTGTYYLTVGGYSNAGLTSFERGNIYQITAANMTFSTDNLHTTPNPTEIDLTITVTVLPWVLVNTLPILE